MHALTALCRALQLIDIDLRIFLLIFIFLLSLAATKSLQNAENAWSESSELTWERRQRTKVIFLFLTANPEKTI